MIANSQHRFSDRVDNYVSYRPHYPEMVYEFLAEKRLVFPGGTVADVGCGTGISAELFLKHHHIVHGIEPNAGMLAAAERYLGNYNTFAPSLQSAEQTGLPDHSIDLVVCAQAFHWFDKAASRKEFKRILKPGGQVLLLWNDRRTPDTGFLRSYEDFLQLCGTDYKEVNHRNTQDKSVFDAFFGHADYSEACFDNFQDFNFEG
ncbi:MAG: class I SAM-dependent methyltransferase, partial [Bacteroidia bacterium]